VSDRLAEFPEATRVALVTFAARGAASAHRRRHDLAFPVLVDVDRVSYGAFGLGRGSVWRVWGFRALRRYIELVRERGLSELHRPTDDTLQLGGDFVIAPDGTLAWGFWGEGPDDRPSIDALIAAVRAITPT
jgi:hypothetical protein